MPRQVVRTELHQIVTKDGLPLAGLHFVPQRRRRTIVFWIGGLTSRFSNHPERTLAQSLRRWIVRVCRS